MKLNQIITSLLETDLYKLTMGQCIFHQFNQDRTKWAFKCRNKDVVFTPEMVEEIKAQIYAFCQLSFLDEELDWLEKNVSWLSKDYISYLRRWYPRIEQISVDTNTPCGLKITAEGEWLDTSMYEIPILAIVNEVYFAFKYGEGALDEKFKENTVRKFSKVLDGTYSIGTFSEFGMRRRYSSKMQDWLVGYIVDNKIPGFVGTSNVYLAKKYGVRPVGTMAHEFIMVVGQGHHKYNPAYSNELMMDAWVKEYGVLNGIALTDTISTDSFLLDFDLKNATLFSGVRHDSGDPFAWGDKMIAHYKKLGIDPKTKTLLFSDSLNFERASDIYRTFTGRTKVAFGIGTYLSNDLGEEFPPLNIVMKVVEANGSPVAKLSDVQGKGMCQDESYIDYLQRCIDWRKNHQSI